MLEIAGGILIAVAILVALPHILAGAYWALVIGVVLTIGSVVWLFLASDVGAEWATVIVVSVPATWWAWNAAQDGEIAPLELLKLVLILPLIVLLGGVAIGVAGFLLVASVMAIILLLSWALGPIGIVAGVLLWIVSCFMLQKWWERRHQGEAGEVGQMLLRSRHISSFGKSEF
jgi:hypothetical protein